MIRAEGLVKRYGPVTAVDHLSFHVEPGETFALIGPNGAGKTTTLKILLGLTRPDEGRVTIGSQGLPPHDARARHDLGYVPQRVDFAPGRTVAQLLGFFAELRGLERADVDRALARVGLLDYASRKASELSGGYTQRLSLAQALLGDPGLLVLDEPTASLDPEATWEFRSLLEQLQREGKTVILSSHLLTEVERVADRVLILLDGRQAALERMADLKARQVKASRLLIELSGDAAAAAEALRRRGLRFESAGPGELIVEASDGQGLAALEALQSAGVRPRSFQIQGPTLEEMFLAVVREKDMKRPYLYLVGIVVVLALALSAAGRKSPRRTAPAPAAASSAPAVAVSLVIRDGAISPSVTRVEKGSRVALTVTNAGSTPVQLALPGYEDRVGPTTLSSGAAWSAEFTADRPGEDFAWTLDGRPAARLIVAGSHLVEGHR